jgi:cytochrome P450
VQEEGLDMALAELGTKDSIGSLLDTVDHEPWAFYQDVRDLGGFVWDERADSWLISSYDTIKQVLLNDEVVWRSSFVWDDEHPPYGTTNDEWTWLAGFGSPNRLTIAHPPEEHARQHRMWIRLLSPNVLVRWDETVIEPIAHGYWSGLSRKARLISGRSTANR